jgi:hypothetical protein
MLEMEAGGHEGHLQGHMAFSVVISKHKKVLCDVLRKYWSPRLWTMQEYVFAQELIFLSGSTANEISTLRKYVDLYKQFNPSEVESLENP